MPLGSESKESFHQVTQRVADSVARTVAMGSDDFNELLEFDDCVYLKSDDGVLIFANQSMKRFFTNGVSPIGRTASKFLDGSIASVAYHLDELVRQGCSYVECEHHGRGSDGSVYRFHSHKRTLRPLGAPGLSIMGVTRVLEKIEDPDGEPLLDLCAAIRKFHGLDMRDQEICRLTALGASSRELSEQIGMTARGVELRKQKAFASLGVDKGVDLARLLVRLQDRGYVDLGL